MAELTIRATDREFGISRIDEALVRALLGELNVLRALHGLRELTLREILDEVRTEHKQTVKSAEP